MIDINFHFYTMSSVEEQVYNILGVTLTEIVPQLVYYIKFWI